MTKKSKTQVNNALIFHITTSVIRFLPACVKKIETNKTTTNKQKRVRVRKQTTLENCLKLLDLFHVPTILVRKFSSMIRDRGNLIGERFFLGGGSGIG